MACGCHHGPVKKIWLAVIAAGALLPTGCAAASATVHDAPVANCSTAPEVPVRTPSTDPAVTTSASATVTIIAADATIYGAVATETVVGDPMPLSQLTDTVVVVIKATGCTGACEIDAAGVPVAFAYTSLGQETICTWNRRPSNR